MANVGRRPRRDAADAPPARRVDTWPRVGAPRDRRRAADCVGRWRSGGDHAPHTGAPAVVDRARVRARGGRDVVDRLVDRRPHPRHTSDELGRRPAGSGGGRVDVEQHCVRTALLGARRRWRGGARSPPAPVRRPRLPSAHEPAARAAELASRIRGLPLPELHQLDGVQPHRCDAARPLGQDRDGGAGDDLACDPRPCRGSGGERVPT